MARLAGRSSASVLLPLAVLLLLVAPPAASACKLTQALTRYGQRHQLQSGSDACSTCKFAVSLLSDLLCDPLVDNTMATWLVSNVCSQMADKAQCADIVRGLTPAMVEWLRVNADPAAMCGSAGVCGASPSLIRDPFRKEGSQKQQLRAARPNDMTCPLCMFVAGKMKEQIADPATQTSIHDASLAACATLPAGINDACNSFVDQYEMVLVKYVADLEPAEVCMMMGTCMDTALTRLQAQRNAPLLALTPALLAPLSKLKAALDASLAAPSNDQCETCKVVVQELHQVVANPDLQTQAVECAKQACAVFPSYQATCQADVDQYAPMAFGMVLAYLQPEQVCVQLKMCPPPSLLVKRFITVETSRLGSKFAAFSIVTTTTTSSSSSAGDAGAVEEDDVDTATSSARPLMGQRAVVKQGKVHGPGLALPMAS